MVKADRKDEDSSITVQIHHNIKYIPETRLKTKIDKIPNSKSRSFARKPETRDEFQGFNSNANRKKPNAIAEAGTDLEWVPLNRVRPSVIQ
jgi:hypothetical protein